VIGEPLTIFVIEDEVYVACRPLPLLTTTSYS